MDMQGLNFFIFDIDWYSIIPGEVTYDDKNRILSEL
jgi:hypothetical protein